MKVADGIETLELTADLATGMDVIHPTLLRDDGSVILVDAGLPGQWGKIREAVENIGISLDRVDKIVITHHDMDHIGGLSSLIKASPHSIDVIAHAEEKPYIQAERPPIRLTQMEAQISALSGERGRQLKALYDNLKANYGNLGVPVTQTVADGDVLPYHGEITVIHTPGHTPGHICLYHRKSRTLIAGDVFNVQDQTLVPAPLFTIWDRDAATRSLKKLTRYDIETVVCYHGGIYKDHANRRIGELSNHSY